MDGNFLPLLPAAEVLVTALVVLVLDLLTGKEEKGLLLWTGLAGLAIAAGIAVYLRGGEEGAFQDTLLLDRFAVFFTVVFLGVAAVTMLASVEYLRETAIREGEFYVLILLSVCGMIVMAAANDLILFFLGLETMSIAVYVLTGMWRSRASASEAAMKYFLIGAFATGFLLYGIALIYGTTGSTQFAGIAAVISAGGGSVPLLFAAGVFLLLVGLAFKVAAVPFHFWVPDVYDGAPTPVTAFMAVGVKAAAFAGWARIFLYQWSPLSGAWAPAVKALAILTMTLGNLLAITQSSVKRMLAYSSIAHAGYLLIAVVAGGEQGGQALLFYVVSYAAMTLGAFGVLIALKEGETDAETYQDFAGLGFRRPFLAMAMSLFMLSLAGFPPLTGFTGKFYLFRAAVAAGHTDLAVIGALNSLVSVFYYLRVIVMMYMEEGNAEAKTLSRAPYLYAGIIVAAIATVYLGIFPAPALDASLKSIAALR
ncbi:MAG TPA: NADH-quinone oxidoreductase subunit N [Verrucomicrobiae bacterium]|nr:NADH-quinone oxidoreductase subunit N [Verrucomicrobiae bacterium]